MADTEKNSLDALRLVAAGLVLYSHQHVLLGLNDPSFFGWSSFGGAGVSIFFFLSGTLVWSSWQRDPALGRVFKRRSLRIFPALWVLVALTVFCLGPVFTRLPIDEYLSSLGTWRYLTTALLLVRYELFGVFADNMYPLVVNGSLWTLPVEFLCYTLVAGFGWWFRAHPSRAVTLGLGLALMGSVLGASHFGPRFVMHFEMAAFFWWGVVYQHLSDQSLHADRLPWGALLGVVVGLLVFWLGSARGVERTALLLFAAGCVVWAQHWQGAASLTQRVGDLSYGLYIFAFPVQQSLAQAGQGLNWSFGLSFGLSLFATAALAWISWHLIEKRALRFKPHGRLSA